jgi:hypothetical protein
MAAGASALAQSVPDDSLFRPPNGRVQSGTFGPARTAQQTDRTRFGDLPVYGVPPASGAGTTGFDSRNRRKIGTRKPPPTAVAAEALPSVLPPPDAVTVPLRVPPPAPVVPPPPTVPQLARRGAPPTDGVTNVPLVPVPALAARKRPSDVDAFEPIGLRVGTFVIKPAVEFSAGYDTNPQHVSGGGGSAIYTIAPELLVRSDWERHALNADIKGSYIDYGHTFVPDLDRPNLDGKVDGRIDVTRDSQIDAQARLLVGTDNPGSPNLQAGLAKLPIFVSGGGTLGYTQRFNRFELSGKASVDRTVYQASDLTDGTTASNDDRNYNQYGFTLRGGYELTPGVKPFVEGGVDSRVHDLAFDRNGVVRDSDGYALRGGSTFELGRKLTGEISAGYAHRDYKDPRLPPLDGPLIAGSLIWSATALTTLKFTATTVLNETTLSGVSGTLTHDYVLEADHAFRRWLLGTLRLGYGSDDYVGSTRVDDRYFAAVSLLYKMNRNMQLKAELRRDWLRSTDPTANYSANAFLVGVRLQD